MQTLDLYQKEVILTASVSCMNLYNLQEDLERVHDSRVSMLHFDVVDGQFNNCIILGTPTLAALRPHTRLPIEVHIAAFLPERLVKQFVDAGADYVSVHYESDSKENLLKCFERIRSLGALPVLALKAQTGVNDSIIELARHSAWVLKLTVEPGYSGQQIQEVSYGNIAALRQALNEAGLPLRIQADGNVHDKTVTRLIESGADMITGGTSGLFLKNVTPRAAAEGLLRQANEAWAKQRRGGNNA